MSVLNQEQLNQIKTENDARMADIAAGKSLSAPAQTTPDTTNIGAFVEQLQDWMLGQTEIRSSADTGLDKFIQSQIEAQTKDKEVAERRIERQLGEKIGEVREAGQTALTSAREAQRGFATNTAALKQIQETTDKQIKEYEQMKQDALMQNDAQFANQMSNLQLQALQFRQQSQQQAFSNILNVAGFAVQASAEERAASQFQQNLELQRQQLEQTKTQNMASLAANADVTLGENETYDTLLTKIANSDLNKLKKEELRTQIEKNQENDSKSNLDLYSQTQLTKLLSGGYEDASGNTAEPMDVPSAVNMVIGQLEILTGNKVSAEQVGDIAKMAIFLDEQRRNKVQEELNNQKTVRDTIDTGLMSVAPKEILKKYTQSSMFTQDVGFADWLFNTQPDTDVLLDAANNLFNF